MSEQIAVDLKSFNRRVGNLTKNNTVFKNEVQQLLCIAAQYAFSDDHNVAPFTNLLMSGKGFRFDGVDNKTLIHWIEAHAPARWDNKELRFRFNKSFKGEYDAVVLLSEPWWKKAAQPKDISSSLDMLEALRGFLKRMEKEAAVEVDGKKRTIEHAEILRKLTVIANDVEYVSKKKEAV